MKYRFIVLFIILTGLFAVPGVLAGDNKVPREGTVYVGEADLDLSDCAIRNGDEIAWWESGNPQGTPTARGRVTDVRSFTVDPETFNGHTGTWYGLIGKKPVFKVEEPFLQVDINENGIDTEPDSIKRGNLVSFKISTNLAGLSQRAGSSGAVVTINLTGPNETEYHTLTSSRTNDFNLDKVYVYASPYDTGAVWDTTDLKKFPDGDYTLSAVTNVNRINEINPESGATYTEKKTYRLGKTEVKASELKDESEDTKSSEEKESESIESVKDDAPNTTSSEVKSSKKKTEAELLREIKEEAAKKTSKLTFDKSSKEATEETTAEPTPEEESTKKETKETGGKDNLTQEETIEPIEQVTETQTTIATPEPTPEITEEPTPDITPNPTRTPFPRPPGPGASPTKKPTPLSGGIIMTAIISGILLVAFRQRYQ